MMLSLWGSFFTGGLVIMTNEQTIKQIKKDLAVIVMNVTEWAEDLLKEYIIEYVYKWGEKQKRLAELRTQGHEQYPVYHKYSQYNTRRYNPSEWDSGYRPSGQASGQFLHSIISERIHADVSDYIGYMIYSDPTRMDYNADTSLHGTRSGNDNRTTLIERLNNAMDDWDGGAQIRWWRDRKPFFDMYLDKLDKEIYKKFFDEMRKQGMNPRVSGISLTGAMRSTTMNERRADTWYF
jgi:hypothetical protein